MISIIKTAIITIIISFISGLLLEYYKDLAPRILCSIGNGTLLELNKKKICAYILTVRNLSNKTIHELTLNIQGSKNNLKVGDSKITKGLKFDSSIKDNILDISIPFLSKDDEFSVTLYVENKDGVYNKPAITIRSPEKFKEVDSIKQKGVLALFNISKNMNKVPGTKKTINKEKREMLHRSKKPSINKNAMAIIVSVVLVMTIGILGKFCFQEISANTKPQSAKTDDQKQSIDAAESAGETNKNTSGKSSTSGTSKNAGAKSLTGGTTKNTGTKTSTDGTSENTDGKSSTDGTTKNIDTKTSTDGTTTNTDTKTSTDGTTKNTGAKTSTDGATENINAKSPAGGTTGNKDANPPASGTNGNTSAGSSTGGTTENTNN